MALGTSSSIRRVYNGTSMKVVLLVGWVCAHSFALCLMTPDADDTGVACDWWHGLPQLFWLSEFYSNPIPSSCVNIELLPVAV